jgi:hypothetical protein
MIGMGECGQKPQKQSEKFGEFEKRIFVEMGTTIC